MPEMPEVETIRRTLSEKVTGKMIADVDILLPRLIKWPSAKEFHAFLSGNTIESLKRRGKYLLFYLDNNYVMVVHLRMTGRLIYVNETAGQDKFTRIIFRLVGGDALLYADTRTLGTIYLLPENELWRIAGLSSLGPEPLSEEFTVNYFCDNIKSRKGTIKALLLNQKFIGGLGNIYVDEALAMAGVHPGRPAFSLTEDEANKLYNSINKVIEQGIRYGGTTFRDYLNGEGASGNNQNHLAVYGRKNKACLICGTPIAKTEVAGRGTHYCPNCQQ